MTTNFNQISSLLTAGITVNMSGEELFFSCESLRCYNQMSCANLHAALISVVEALETLKRKDPERYLQHVDLTESGIPTVSAAVLAALKSMDTEEGNKNE